MKEKIRSPSHNCHSNNVSIEFLPFSFLVNELRTGAILLKGQMKDGVHKWPSSSLINSPSLAFSSVKKTSSEWHHRLGHLAFPVLI